MDYYVANMYAKLEGKIKRVKNSHCVVIYLNGRKREHGRSAVDERLIIYGGGMASWLVIS